MKKNIIITILFLFLSAHFTIWANGDVTGDKAIVIQVNGGAKILYNVYTNWSYGACGSYNTSTAATLSNLGNLHSLILNGVYVTGWTDNTDWVAGQVEWKIWLTTAAEPGTMSGSFNVGGYGSACSVQDVACSSGNNRFVGMDNQSVDLINGLAPGEYYFKVYPHGQMRYNCGSFNQVDNPAITVTFTIDPKVTFNSNGGSGSMSDQYVTYNTSTQLSTNTFTRTGYIFSGWNTAADGSGTSYADEQNVTLTENITLYAQWSAYTTAQDGDWNTASTWTCNCVPPADAATQINHDITLNATATNNPASIEITAGNSITFGASGDITATLSITNNGTIDMTSGGILRIGNGATFTNSGTFTGGTGEVYFPGTGTVSGSITFYNVSIAGGVNFGGSAAVNNILQIYSGGWLNTNSITYNSGSTLKYAGNYTINSGDKSWYSNVGSTGSAQEGIPWNVEISSGVTVALNDSYQFDINGSIAINGSFTLGTDGGSHWGDFALRGDFIFNSGGTFTHNSRTVKFIGTALQNISGTQSPTFAYLLIDNSSNLNLSQNITVATQISFTNGKIILNNYNVNAETSAVNSFDNSKYFVTNGTGYLIRNVGNSEITFPVGTTTIYAPAYLTQAGTQENLYVRVKQGIDNPTNDDDFVVNLQWTIDEQTAGSNNLTTKFQWNSTDENTYFDRNGQVKIGRYIAAAYSSSNATVAGSDPYTASASGMADDISAEIPFIVGNTMAFTSNGYRTAQNGNWNTASTWVGNAVPPADAVCAILHHVTVNSVLNNAVEVNIYSGKSVTFQAGGSLTVNGTFLNSGMLKTDAANASVTINGTLKNSTGASLNMVNGGTIYFATGSTFTNSGTFTSGTGTIDFQGNGTATGTLSFYNLKIAGNVDLGNAASLNNILTLSSSGDLITNSISYLEGSILKFDKDYSLGDNKVWYRNTDASGSAQVGIPWHVQIESGRTVNISDDFYRAINGNLTIDGTFALSGSAGGDFKIKGNFENNGTFTHNSRQITFYGLNNQKINGTVASTFAYILINNNSNVTLEKSCTIANNLDFSNGKIILGNYDLTVSTGASISNYNSSKYVVTNGTGYLIYNIATSASAFYPVGTFSGYNPANLSQGSAATTDNIGLRVTNSIENIVDDPTQIVNAQWTINEAVAGGNDLTTQLYWNLTDEAGSFNRSSGTVETRYYSAGYTPAGPPYSTIAGTNPYNATAGYVYNGNLSNLPFIVADATAFSGGIFTIANGNWNNTATWNGGVIPGTGQCALVRHIVTLDMSPTVKTLSVSSSGTLNCSSYTINLDNGGAISNSGTFNAQTGKVVFTGAGSISTGTITFNDVDINGAVSFGSNSTIAGILSINAGGSVNVNPPKYATTSTLKYNQSGSVLRSYEWQYNLDVDDPGYPANVQISNSTTLDVDADNNDDNYYQTRFLNGNITIDAGSAITLNDMGGGTAENQICGLYAKGNIINNGTITLSSNFGGDMMLEGNLTNTGTINWNSRAVFFTGDAGVNQNVTGVTQIPFVLITRGATVVLNNNLEVNGGGTEFITFARPSSTNTGKVNLNNFNLTCSGAGNIELNNIAGAEVTGTGRVEVSGGNATYSGISGGTLSFGTNVTLAINGGTMTFPSTLGIVTIYGTLEVGDGATITNIPTYGDNSTLHYKKGGTFTMGVEWTAGSDVADNIPYNVTVSQGSTPSVLNMNATRYALGELLIEENATLQVTSGTGQLTVNNLTVDANGTIVLKSPSDNGVAGSLITYGTVTNNGTMQAERYVSGGKYTYLAPPNAVTNSQTFTNNPNGYFNPNFYSYNQAFAAPSDPATATYAEWKIEANQFSDAWVEAHDGEGGSGIVLNVPGRGYAYYNDINRMFVFDGTFNSGDKNITVYYDDNDANSGYFDGWNLIANPYPSALDWTDASWDKTYVESSVYYWDGTYENEGNYKYYVASVYDDGTNVVNGGSQFIPASQAFFVKAKNTAGSGGQSFTIPNNAREHNTQEFWGKGNNTKNSKSSTAFIRLKANANNTTDELVVRYISEGTSDFDGNFDAYKMYSYSANVPQVYSFNSENDAGYAINSLNENSLNDTLNIGIEIAKNGVSECSFELVEFKTENRHVYLEDIQENNIQNLISKTSYTFFIDDSSDIRGRFYIHYEENQAPVLSGNLPDYSIDFGEIINYQIDNELFTDVNEGDVITYQAMLSNNQPIPAWLYFDNKSCTFFGSPEYAQSIEIRIIATDIFGESVSDDFLLTVNPVLPVVSTDQIIQTTTNSAIIQSSLISNGGIDVQEVGICWNTAENPVIDDNYFVSVLDENSFIGIAEDLLPNTTYFVRSYAVNSVGIQYGNQMSFATSALSIDENNNKNFNVYPNPTNDYIFVSNYEMNKVVIIITDVFGKELYKQETSLNNQKIDMTGLNSGLYFVEIISDETLVFKIIKK